jgi:O-antigen/teichoic acid export membrane protein
MAVATLAAGPIIRAWVGHGAVMPSADLIGLMFLWNVVIFVQQPFGYLLAGFSEVKRTTWYALASAATCGVCMAWLVHPLGPKGVVLGLILGTVPFNLLGNMFEAWKLVRPAKSGIELGGAENLRMKTT